MKKILITLFFILLLVILFFYFNQSSINSNYSSNISYAENVSHTLNTLNQEETYSNITPPDTSTYDINKISISIKENSATPESVTIIIKDLNTPEPTTGAAFSLQVKNNNTWENYPPLSESITWNLLAYVGKDYILEQKLNFTNIYGNLHEGIYRICKNISIDGTNYPVYSNEFEIKK